MLPHVCSLTEMGPQMSHAPCTLGHHLLLRRYLLYLREHFCIFRANSLCCIKYSSIELEEFGQFHSAFNKIIRIRKYIVFFFFLFLQECFTYVLKGHIAVSAAVFPNGTKGAAPCSDITSLFFFLHSQ